MKAGHLKRRPCRGRAIAWSRIPSEHVLASGSRVVTAVEYRLFLRLSTTGQTLFEARVFPLELLATASIGGRSAIARTLRGMRAQLRWRRDQLDLANLGLQDDTPAPAVPA